MLALIIGASGFVGRHLVRQLRLDGYHVVATKSHSLTSNNFDISDVDVYEVDILSTFETNELLSTVKPDIVFHLASQSSVALSWTNPQLTVDVNIKGTINVLEGVRGLKKELRLLLIGSGEEYGYVSSNGLPINEESKLIPKNIYAVTKITQGLLGKVYVDAYDMDVVIVRAFNHIGPGQKLGFVVPDFCKQIIDIECKLSDPVINVGNLEIQRDFTDVRDIVCAYSLIAKKGQKGAIYNVGSGTALSIRKLLDHLISLTDKDITVNVDKSKFRPVDVPVIVSDNSLLIQEIGWKPQIPLERTLRDTLDYWRCMADSI